MTAPLAVLDPTDTADDLAHVVCCLPSTTMCGLDIADMTWTPAPDEDRICAICEIALREGLPCASPTCPERTR